MTARSGSAGSIAPKRATAPPGSRTSRTPPRTRPRSRCTIVRAFIAPGARGRARAQRPALEAQRGVELDLAVAAADDAHVELASGRCQPQLVLVVHRHER